MSAKYHVKREGLKIITMMNLFAEYIPQTAILTRDLGLHKFPQHMFHRFTSMYGITERPEWLGITIVSFML